MRPKNSSYKPCCASRPRSRREPGRVGNRGAAIATNMCALADKPAGARISIQVNCAVFLSPPHRTREGPVLSKSLAPKKESAQILDERQSQLKLLIARGKEQGFLTYVEVNDHLPSEIVDPEQIEDIVNMINDMGIPVYEKAPDSEPLLATENSQPADEEAIEEAAAALAALDAELGRTTDPVRMYMRETGTVALLTRAGEISIAKRIEEGLDAVRRALAHYPATFDQLLSTYEQVKGGQGRLVDIIVGFIDPNAPDVIAQPQNPTKMEAATPDKGDKDKNEEEEEEETETTE